MTPPCLSPDHVDRLYALSQARFRRRLRQSVRDADSMLSRLPRHFGPGAKPPPVAPDDWSVAGLLALTFVALGERADATQDAVVSGWLVDLQFTVGPTGPFNQGRRMAIAGLIAERMGRPAEPKGPPQP